MVIPPAESKNDKSMTGHGAAHDMLSIDRGPAGEQ
jgi:hypothetical protein